MLGNRKIRAQSAMEYLMTYGWAILIIAVVLGALFSLGVFSGSNLLGTSCVASPGYYCQQPVLNTAGLTFTFGQNTGSPIYNLFMACSATSASTGLPSGGPAAFNAIRSDGQIWAGAAPNNALSSTTTNGMTLASGQTVSVGLVSGIQTAGANALPCVTTTGTNTVASAYGVGSSFSGFIWINYTASSAAPGASNPWYTVKVATVSLKVV